MALEGNRSVLKRRSFLARRIRLSAQRACRLPAPGPLWCFLTQKEKLRFSKLEIAVWRHWQPRHFFDDHWFYTLTRSLTWRGDRQRAQSEEGSNKPHRCNKAGLRIICQFVPLSYGTVTI